MPGCAQSEVVLAGRVQTIILFVTHEKQTGATPYADELAGDTLHWEGEEKHQTDDRIIRAADRGDRIHLFYRSRHHSDFTYHGEIRLTSHQLRTDGPSRFVFALGK